jgi:hypothetical protein
MLDTSCAPSSGAVFGWLISAARTLSVDQLQCHGDDAGARQAGIATSGGLD